MPFSDNYSAAVKDRNPHLWVESFAKLEKINPKAVELMQEMAELQLAKGHDYSGKQKDTLHNLRCAEDLGVESWIGVLIRAGDKWRRVCNYAQQRVFKVLDEGFKVTCLDLANYCLFAVILHEEKNNKIDPVQPDVKMDPAQPVVFQDRFTKE